MAIRNFKKVDHINLGKEFLCVLIYLIDLATYYFIRQKNRSKIEKENKW
jgi:hypothetical protein